jgi:type I restriction enzyme, S subunit
MENSLPKGWTFVELRHLGEYTNGRAFKASEWKNKGLPIVRIQNLNKPDAVFNYSDKNHEEKYLIKKGELLMAWSASLGVYIWSKGDAWLNQHIFKVVHNQMITTKKFLYYALKEAIQEFYQKTHGSGIVHITKPVFESHEIPLPPLEEQQRIVAKLDELMEKIDRSYARLERIPKILKRFRQSILSAAVSGKLTEEWREKSNIVGEWKEMELKDVIIDKPKNGFSAKPVKHKTKFRVLTLTATTSGRFIPDHFKYFDEPIESNSQFWLQPNDILVQRGNALEYVGVPAIYDGQPNQFIYPDLMMRLRVNELVTTKFLYYFLSAESTRSYLRDRATGTSGNMPKINQPTLMGVPISLPSDVEQEEIVKRIEQLFTLADKIEARYRNAKVQLDKLPQSLLAKAFRGEIVPQHENDEPARVLLERVRERNRTNKEKTKAGTVLNRKSKKFTDIISYLLTTNGPVTQDDILKNVKIDPVKYFTAISDLIEAKKIIRNKIGSTVTYSIKK